MAGDPNVSDDPDTSISVGPSLAGSRQRSPILHPDEDLRQGINLIVVTRGGKPNKFIGELTQPVRTRWQEQPSGHDYRADVHDAGNLVALRRPRNRRGYTKRLFRAERLDQRCARGSILD